MTAIDPHRTLGLSPGASQAEIKHAYRYLAKLYHPDSAGERALPRFLAIQAAYEALVEDPGRRRLGRAGSSYRASEPPAHPWQADASRARATREAYRARTRRSSGGAAPGPPGSGPGFSPGASAAGTTGTRSTRSGTGSTTGGGTTGSRGTTGGRGPTGSTGTEGAGGAAGPAQPGRSRRSRGPKATIGSTSYDGADKEPFDPAWEGATWYGPGSGTYWTLNPKEYADPRKHGPEYQARSRRSRGGSQSDADPFPGDPPGRDDPENASASNEPPGDAPDPGGSPATGPDWSTPGNGPSTNDRPWPPSPAPGPSPSARPQADPAAGARPANRGAAAALGAHGGSRPPGPPPRSTVAGDSARWRPPVQGVEVGGSAGLVETAPSAVRRASLTLPGRIGLAVLGWIPLGVALSIVSDAMPACSGVVSVCSDPLKAGSWPIHLLLVALLVALPRLGAIAAYAAASFLIVGLVATPILLALGGAQTPAGTRTVLGIVLIAAWLGGVALALSGRVELPPWRGPRVR